MVNTSIDERNLRGDLIETYRFLKGKLNLDPRQLFELGVKRRCQYKRTQHETIELRDNTTIEI